MPPYQDLDYQASPNTNLKSGDLVTHTITFEREYRNYSVTLSFTNSVPPVLAVVPGSLHASEGDPPQVQGDMVSWRNYYEPGTLTTTVTISYVTAVGDCYATAVTADSKPWLTATQPLTNVVWLRELTNDIVTTPGAPGTDTATVYLTLPPCGVYAPLILNYPPFPKVLDGNFTIMSSASPWTQQINDIPGNLIYSNAELPRVVQRPSGPNVVWLGGTKNSINTLQQTIASTAPYSVKLRFDYYTASDEDDCLADKAGVYLGDTLLPLLIKLCNGKGNETNQWTTAYVDLPAVASASNLRFVTDLNGARNSNWFVSNVELCSDAVNVPPGTPKCTK
ncbi:MAG: hypothetical protein U0X20_24430 [Caldilineaceae bacterium]